MNTNERTQWITEEVDWMEIYKTGCQLKELAEDIILGRRKTDEEVDNAWGLVREDTEELQEMINSEPWF